jgi:hypothetical protein
MKPKSIATLGAAETTLFGVPPESSVKNCDAVEIFGRARWAKQSIPQEMTGGGLEFLRFGVPV